MSLSTPRARFAWQAWYFLYLHRCQRKLGDILGLMWRRGLLRGRRGTFCTSIDVSGSLATFWDCCGAAVFCVAGVSLSTPRARFAWQAWYFLYLHRCQQKLGDILGLMWRRGLLRGRRVTFNTSGSIGVAGVVLSVPP